MSIDKQLQLEEESVALGFLHYHERKDKQARFGSADESVPGRQLINRTLQTVAEAIDLDRNTPRRGRGRQALPLIEEIDGLSLAWHGLRALVACIGHPTTYVKGASKVGSSVRDELNFRRFNEEAQHSYRMTQEHLATAGTSHRRKGIMRRMLNLSDVEGVGWGTEETIRVGTYILDIVIRVTGWAEVALVNKSRNRTTRIIRPTTEILDWFEKAHDQLAQLVPVRQPMVVEPQPWTSPTEGGYLTELGGRLSLVKTDNDNYLEALEQVDMPEVYAAINAIQQVPWRINHGILNVGAALWEEGVQVGHDGNESLPSRHPAELPAVPAQWLGKGNAWKEQDYDGYKLWSQRAAAVHDANNRLISKRTSAKMKLQMALKFSEEPAIYFPHQMDFRGRVYPVTTFLSPQGDDLSKALIQFAEGKPIGEEGIFWLKVHIANCFGVDKVSFEERVAWVDEHHAALLNSGLEPLDGSRFWMEAEDPFLALAGCFELAGVALAGADYVSHLPVSMDGSCNGLQNFSALLRDPVGGKATNLVPGPKPADIYHEVASLVAQKVREDAESGEHFGIVFDGYISRKLVKQPVMTLPYGATRNGMVKQIEAAIKKLGNPMGLTTRDTWAACGYLADVTREAIGQVVVAAVDAMDWLQAVAREVAGADYPIRWTSPVGFPVLQEYRRPIAQTLRVHVDGQKVKLNINKRGDKLDRRRQATGISPNLIHSFDAAHMMKTTLLAGAYGVTAFAMIHDSFGTHACDVSVLHAAIREAFKEQYAGDLLGDFKAELEEQLPEDLVLPDLPPSGTLELAVVEDSRYFFA